MKRYLLVFAAGGALVLASCGNKSGGGMTDTEKKNLETSRAIVKMFESSDWSKVGDYIATDAVDHAGMNGDVKGLDSIKASFAEMGNQMSDMKNEVVQEVASGDYVYQWMIESWTNKVDGMGMKAGDRSKMQAIEVSRLKDGKVEEHWAFISITDMMKMMQSMMGSGNNGGGGVGNGNNGMMTDTTAK